MVFTYLSFYFFLVVKYIATILQRQQYEHPGVLISHHGLVSAILIEHNLESESLFKQLMQIYSLFSGYLQSQLNF